MNVSAPRPQVSAPSSVPFSAQGSKPEAKSAATGSSGPRQVRGGCSGESLLFVGLAGLLALWW
jgi:hypothetical protein